MYEEEGNRNCKYEKPNSNILNIFQKLARLDRIIHGDQVLTRTVLGHEFLIAGRNDMSENALFLLNLHFYMQT